MPRWRVCTPVEQLQPFESGDNVDLREAGWTYQLTAADTGHSVLVVRCCFQQWSVEYSHIRRPGSGWQHTTDPVKIDTLCEQWWPPEQHPGKKFGHMLHLLCHQAPLETICLQQDSDHMCLWADYHLHMTPPSTAILVSWKSQLESGMVFCCLQWWE